MLTIKERRFIKRTRKKLDINGQRVGFDNSKAKEELPTNHALMAFTSSGSSSSLDSEFKTGLGYDAATAASPAVESFVNLTHKSGSDKGYHSVPPPLTGNFIPHKPDLTFMDEIVESENLDITTVVTPSNIKTVENKGVSNTVESNAVRMNNTSAPIIEDWNSDDESEIDYSIRPNTKKIESVNRIFLTKSWKLSTAGATINTVKTVNTANTKVVNTVRSVNTAASKLIVNHPKTKTNAFKRGYSQSLRPFNKHFENKNSIINTNVNTTRVKHTTARDRAVGYPQQKEYKEKGVIESGCSRHMTGNKCYLDEYEDYDGGFVSFGDGKGRISRKGKIKTGSLDFDDVYFCKELKYNLFSVSQICDKKNNVLFTDTECLVLSSNFKLLDESQVLLRVPRKDNIYSVDLKSVVPTGGLTCLIAKATIDESNTWHRRLGHINFKTMNKLVKGNLVKGLPSKIFENDHSCVACQKGKQHKASYKTKLVKSISKPLHMLHMDLFGPTNVKSLMKKSYCLVVTDDFSRFSWVFFLATKDETSGILKTFITEIENQLDHKVKVIRSDNGTEFKNSIMNQFCEMKGIKREFSVARTPQQNGVAERKNRTLIEAARTMLVDSKLPTTFWAEAVNTACYVLNRVLVIKPHNKTPYELIRGRPPLIDFMKPFGCPVTILNTRDHLGKFDGKADEGYFVGYSVVSKAMRVFNKRTRIVEETLNIRFLENTPNVKGNGPDWLFDVDSLSISMNYVPDSEEDVGMKPTEVNGSGASDKGEGDKQDTRSEFERILQQEKQTNSTNSFNTVGTPVSTAGPSFTNDDPSSPVNAVEASNAFEDHLFERFSPFKNAFALPHVPNVFSIDDTGILIQSWIEAMQEGLYSFNFRRVWNRNKAILVAQGYTQEEGIDYDEVFDPVARIEAIRRGTIDKTLFIQKDKGDIWLVLEYVDNIIFGSINKSSCDEFGGLMHMRFQMSSMGDVFQKL
ncbi:putative ribonuclease H-like domain-containing protein [Tanacetum coccineum]